MERNESVPWSVSEFLMDEFSDSLLQLRSTSDSSQSEAEQEQECGLREHLGGDDVRGLARRQRDAICVGDEGEHDDEGRQHECGGEVGLDGEIHEEMKGE